MKMAIYKVSGWVNARVSTLVEADNEEDAYDLADRQFAGVDYIVYGDDDEVGSSGIIDWDDCEEWE